MHPATRNGVRQRPKLNEACRIRYRCERDGGSCGSQGADGRAEAEKDQPSIGCRRGRFDGVGGMISRGRDIAAQPFLMTAARRQQCQAYVLVVAPGLLRRVQDPRAVRQPGRAAVRAEVECEPYRGGGIKRLVGGLRRGRAKRLGMPTPDRRSQGQYPGQSSGR